MIGLDPNGADGYETLGEILNWSGRPEETVGLVKRAMRLNPRHSFFYTWSLGHSYVLMGKIEEAIATMKEVLDQNPNCMPAHAYLAFMYTEMGRIEEARSHMAESNRLSPGTSLERD